MSVARVSVKDIALALLTTISMPPNLLIAFSTADFTCPSSLISTIQGRALPPASSTKCFKYIIVLIYI